MPTPAPTPSPDIQPPVAAAAVRDAGVILFRNGHSALYRYDGDSGTIENLLPSSAWSFIRETGSGVYALGLNAGAAFVPWSGAPTDTACGIVIAVSSTGACVARSYDAAGGLFVQYPELGATLLLPRDWGAGLAWWDPTSRYIAVTRTIDQRCMRCPNTLWLIGPDGVPRRLYDPQGRGAVTRVWWSPSGRSLAVSLSTGCAGCDANAGDPLVVLDVATGAAVDLGRTPGSSDVRWSPRGDLAFVSGTLYEIARSELRVRTSAGLTSTIATSATHPAWDSSGSKLGWIAGGGSAVTRNVDTGETTRVTCGDRTVVGIRFSARGDGQLLLCRLPDPVLDRYELHYRSNARDVTVIERLGGSLAYLVTPDFFELVAWSEDL